MKQYNEAELKRIAKALGMYWIASTFLAPYARVIANELEDLAEQSQSAFNLWCAIERFSSDKDRVAESLKQEAASLRAWADEQDKPTELTILERLREVKRRTDKPVAVAIGTLVDALIELYERKE